MSDRDDCRSDEVASYFDEGTGIELVVEDDRGHRTLNVYNTAGACLTYVTSDEPEFDDILRAMSGKEEVAVATPDAPDTAVIAKPSQAVYVVHSGGGTVYVATTDELTAYREAYRICREYGHVVVEAYRDGVLVEVP